MREEDLHALLQRIPCPLLRLHTTCGMIFEIREPETVFLGRSTVELLLPPNSDQTREAVISLLHIIWVEVISPPP